MFNFLKEKLKNWTEKLSKKAEEKLEKPEKTEEEPKKQEKKKKEIEMPVKFNAGMEKFEPDLEKLEEVEEEERGFFKKIKEKIAKVKVSEKDFEVYEEELKMLLLENNVAVEVAEKMIKQLKERIVGKEFLKKEIEGMIKESFKDIIYEILIQPPNIVDEIIKKAKEPYVMLFCGINGSGKTTTIAKVAEHLKKNKISCVIAAADTFRAASIEQIKKHGERINVPVISHDYGADPASVGFDAIKYAKKNSVECVLIDTAGRMHTAKNLLKEMEKIVRVCKPDLKIFIGESITGNDSIEQIKSFNEAIGIDALILTKADIDEKGGTALSLGYVTKKPILFLGTGQAYDSIEVFDRKKFVERLGL
jgi:fused signal recognition particle receptor